MNILEEYLASFRDKRKREMVQKKLYSSTGGFGGSGGSKGSQGDTPLDKLLASLAPRLIDTLSSLLNFSIIRLEFYVYLDEMLQLLGNVVLQTLRLKPEL